MRFERNLQTDVFELTVQACDHLVNFGLSKVEFPRAKVSERKKILSLIKVISAK